MSEAQAQAWPVGRQRRSIGSVRNDRQLGKRKRPDFPRGGETLARCLVGGRSSSVWLFGQVGRFSRFRVLQVVGSIPFRRAVFSGHWRRGTREPSVL